MDLEKLTDDELRMKYYSFVNEMHDLTISEKWDVFDQKEPEFLKTKEEMKRRGLKV